jgi:hypothetical protein
MRVYTLAVFATRYAVVRQLKKQTIIERQGFGFQGWNPNNSHEPGRLPGSGSFTFVGLHEVRRAAMRYLETPGVHQVAVKTNQDREVYRYFKQPDGSITGYLADREDR